MGKNNSLILLGLGAAAVYLFTKSPKTQTTTEQDSWSSSSSGFVGGGFMPLLPISENPPAVVVTPEYKPAASSGSSSRSGGSVNIASAATLKNIDNTAAARPNEVLYYPDYGIVTTGGLGYSTANPAAYLTKDKSPKILVKSPLKNPYVTNSSYFKLGSK